MTTIKITGDDEITFEPFPHFRISRPGKIDATLPVGDRSYTQAVGPLSVTVSFAGGIASVAVSAFGFSQQFQVAKLTGQPPRAFKFELDPGNYVEGTISLVAA